MSIPSDDSKHPVNSASRCSECGAAWRNGETCAERFAALLALDHSREEPWGSRHALAFAVYSLQHPASVTAETLQRCWTILQRVYVAGVELSGVVRSIRAEYRNGRTTTASIADNFSDILPMPDREPPRVHQVTIVDLGSFPRDTYPADLDAWCRATLEAWRE